MIRVNYENEVKIQLMKTLYRMYRLSKISLSHICTGPINDIRNTSGKSSNDSKTVTLKKGKQVTLLRQLHKVQTYLSAKRL